MHENTLSSSFSGHNSLEKALFNVVDSCHRTVVPDVTVPELPQLHVISI